MEQREEAVAHDERLVETRERAVAQRESDIDVVIQVSIQNCQKQIRSSQRSHIGSKK